MTQLWASPRWFGGVARCGSLAQEDIEGEGIQVQITGSIIGNLLHFLTNRRIGFRGYELLWVSEVVGSREGFS
jgi:hypothetical protein